MPLSPQQRSALIEDLVTNCDCWKHQGDREILNAMADEKLAQFKEQSLKQQQALAVANAAVSGFSDGITSYRVNPQTGKWEKALNVEEVKGKGSKQTTNTNATNATDMKKGMGKKGMPKRVVEEDEEDMEDMEDNSALPPREEYVEDGESPKVNKKKNQQRPQTTEQMIRGLPEELQNRLRIAGEIEQHEKKKLIDQLLVNVSSTDKRAHTERLMHRSVEDLRNDLALVPKREEETPEQKRQNSHNRRKSSNPSGTRHTILSENLEDDVLVVPTINWQEVGKTETPVSPLSKKQAGQVDNWEIDEEEEDYLASLPPHVRTRIQNAEIIETREKQKYIDELVSNVTDDEMEAKLRNRLSNKSLDELRDLANLVPNSQMARTPSYFGSQGVSPATNSNRNTNTAVDSDDVLPLPTIDWRDVAKGNRA